jgi:spermidine/putrescine-binding protein
MCMTKIWRSAAMAAMFGAGFLVHGLLPGEPVAHAQSARIFELRTYTAPEGKLEALHARFKNDTLRLFKQHGMENIAYFRPADAPLSQNTMIYLLAFPNREAAKKSWADFQADPEWVKINADTQKDGRIVAKLESVFLEPTDYSPLK